MLDILIRGGLVPDYQENRLKALDVGIKDGAIVLVRPAGEITQPAAETIEAAGRVVSPGFIDIHMHEEDFIHEGDAYVIAELMLRMGVTTCLGGNCGMQKQSTRQFRETIDKLGGSPVNYMLMAGYNTARTAAGFGHLEAAPEDTVRRLADQLHQELKDGAYGISFGLEYDPGITFDEVCFVLNHQKIDGLFSSMHYRADSSASPDAVNEMIRIADATGTRFQISHLSSCSAMGQMTDVLHTINEAIERNPLLNYDTYPYNAFSTQIGSEVFSEGCFESWGKSYGDILLTNDPFKNQRCTKEIFETARRDYPDMLAVAFVMNESEIAEAIANRYGMIASDAIINNGNGHPRAAGTFPRVLGKYVREDKVISLIDALRKMTLLPAGRLELAKKGEIREGFDADITIFDPDTIRDGATFDDLHIPPVGIDEVLLGGKVALLDGEIKNDRLGRFIPSGF